MRFLAVLLVAEMLWAGVASAGSYVRVSGTVVNSIKYTSSLGGGVHPYSGIRLESGAGLAHVDLSDAYLYQADLRFADLRDAKLAGVYLRYASLSGADLSGATLSQADLRNADLTNVLLYAADLGNVLASPATSFVGARYSLNAVGHDGTPIPDTIFPLGFDPDAHGMIAAPEPTTALLLGLGLVGLGVGRRPNRCAACGRNSAPAPRSGRSVSAGLLPHPDGR